MNIAVIITKKKQYFTRSTVVFINGVCRIYSLDKDNLESSDDIEVVEIKITEILEILLP